MHFSATRSTCPTHLTFLELMILITAGEQHKLQSCSRAMINAFLNNTGNGGITQHSGAFVPPLLQWKSNDYYILWVCGCILSHPAWNAHAPVGHLWSARLYIIFQPYPIKGTSFEKKKIIEHKMCVLNVSTTCVWNIPILRRNERDMIKKVYRSSCEVRLFLSNYN